MNFIEPNKDNFELTASVLIGTNSMTELAEKIQSALNDAGKNEYTVSFDRDTRLLTIVADDLFDLLVTTGSNAGLSVYSLIGFTADKTGLATYEADEAFGTEYKPQYALQDFKDADNSKEGIFSKINESASGVIEVVTFGSRQFYELNIKWITNRNMGKSNFLDNNQSAIEEARSFMDFCIEKNNLEFMRDLDNRSGFDKVLLETTRKSKQGTSYELTELLRDGLDGYFETGRLKFRRA